MQTFNSWTSRPSISFTATDVYQNFSPAQAGTMLLGLKFEQRIWSVIWISGTDQIKYSWKSLTKVTSLTTLIESIVIKCLNLFDSCRRRPFECRTKHTNLHCHRPTTSPAIRRRKLALWPHSHFLCTLTLSLWFPPPSKAPQCGQELLSPRWVLCSDKW